jgi:hypothetical protein
VGQAQSPPAVFAGQLSGVTSGASRWHPGCRRCLLKGCEQWFLAQRPQARYCSTACRHAARRWRRWHAAQRYRATTHGKQRRRDQSRRYRGRRRERLTHPEPSPPAPTVTPPPTGEGQRPAEIPEKSPGLPCDRPGCYLTFPPTLRSPQQHFCSGHCRQALRRVRQRELRLRLRRRHGARPWGRRHRGPPAVGPFMSSRIETAPP